jgi:hypothetical protein
MWEPIIKWCTLVIAALALIRPELVFLFNRVFKKEEIEIHKFGNIEVEYNQFGPVIGVYGQLRCLNRDLFVHRIDLKLERKRDTSTHPFEWFLFRSTKFTIKGEVGPLERPSGIMLSTSSPHRFLISFNDTETYDVMRQAAEKLNKEWTDYIFEQKKQIGLDNADLSKLEITKHYKNFKEGKGGKSDRETYATLNREFYWSPGDYNLEIIVSTWKPKLKFKEKWEFKLTEKDSEILRLNIIKLMDDIYGSPEGNNYTYDAITVKCEKVKPSVPD